MYTVYIGMVDLNIRLGICLFVKEHKGPRSVDYHDLEVRDGTHIGGITIVHQNVASRSRIDYGAVRGGDPDAHVSWRIVEVTLSRGRRGIAHAVSITDGRW